MTHIVLDKNNNRYLIKATGHATGSEKVCSAISSLLWAIAGWITNNPDKLKYHKMRIDSGNTYIEFSGGVIAEAVWEVAAIGLMQIEKQYPEYIKVMEAAED